MVIIAAYILSQTLGLKNWFFFCDCGVSGEGCLGAGFLFVTIGGGTFGFVH